MGNWTISIRSRTTSARLVTILLSHVLFATVSQSRVQAQSDAGAGWGIYSQKMGLDAGNPIDKLISRFGFACAPELRKYSGGRPCKVEREVAAFVDSLPHNRKDITEALAALGATCVDPSQKLIDCVYRKRVPTSGWITGETEPRWSIDEIFVFHITAARGEPFEANVELTRTEEKPDSAATCRTGDCR